MTHRAPGLIRIPQHAVVNKLVTAYDFAFDVNGVEVSRTPTDFSGGGIMYLTVRDQFGNIVIQKTSESASQIELTVPLTSGQGTIKFVEADTAPLSNNRKLFQYYFDVWAKTSDGREEPIVDRGQFFVDKSVTRISEGISPSLPTFPASQGPQERSFVWEAPVDGDIFTITIPGAMVEPYLAISGLAAIPLTGNWVPTYCPEIGMSANDFQLECGSEILAGTRVYFILRGV